MHVIAIAFPLLTGMFGAVMDFSGPSELLPLCWVDDYPRNCGVETGITCYSPLIGWIFAGLPFLIMVLCLVINNTLICGHACARCIKNPIDTLPPCRRSRGGIFRVFLSFRTSHPSRKALDWVLLLLIINTNNKPIIITTKGKR